MIKFSLAKVPKHVPFLYSSSFHETSSFEVNLTFMSLNKNCLYLSKHDIRRFIRFIRYLVNIYLSIVAGNPVFSG